MEYTARAIIKIDDDFVFMKRCKKNDVLYYTTIGGHLDGNETYEEACKREIFEEIGVNARIDSLFMEINNVNVNKFEKIFLVTLDKNEFTHGNGEEFSNNDFEKYGSFEIVRINKDELYKYNILPVELKDKIIKDLI